MTDEIVPVSTDTGGEAPVAPSAPVTTDNTTTEVPTTPTEFAVPEAYAEKGWSKNIKSTDDLWKNYDNAQELIGKKTIGIPDENSTPEQVQEYYSKIRPENAEVYAFPEDTTQAEKDLYSKALYDNGVSKNQAEGIIKAHSDFVEQQKTVMFSADGMDKVMKESFGEDTEAREGAKKLLDANSNDADKSIINTMTNEQVGAMYRLANSFSKTHGVNEGNAINNNPNSAGTPVDKESARKAIYKEMTDLATKPHTAEQKQALQTKLDALYTGGK